MQEMERESTDHSKFIVHVKPDKIYKSLTALDKISRRRGEALARTTSFPLSLDITGFNGILHLSFLSRPEVCPGNQEKHYTHVKINKYV